MEYNTKILSSDVEGIRAAAEILKKGEVVAIPTETVYGLAANALDSEAVKRIFAAKGRPGDNPLIVHISGKPDIYKYAREVPKAAEILAEAFWPGPVTMVMKKADIIPFETSGGLDTVGIRFPAHKAARAIIEECGFPLAAPSANLSGSPSPTRFSHVMADMNGRIPGAVDGLDCAVGVESTVVCFEGDNDVRILRPGFVSKEDIEALTGIGKVICDRGVTERINEGERVMSPGMKYRHYSPKAAVTLIEGSAEALAEFMENTDGNMGGTIDSKVCAMIFDGDEEVFRGKNYITYGYTSEEQARQVFDCLRRVDDEGYEKVYVRSPRRDGVGLAVYNRLLRAAGFEVILL